MDRKNKTTEPDFRLYKKDWIMWNMLEYNNDIETACQLLRQKEIIYGL